MISRRRPTVEQLQGLLAEQSQLGFSYEAVGGTRGAPPAGFVVDRTRTVLGAGRATFEAAKAALQRWDQFRLGWVEIWPAHVPLQTESVVLVLANVGPVWWTNAARIVYTIDEVSESVAFGFAYGTLPGHAERGEERFAVTWDERTGEVVYEVFAFSRPSHPLARLGYPLTRRLQRQFARQSCDAMRRAVGS